VAEAHRTCRIAWRCEGGRGGRGECRRRGREKSGKWGSLVCVRREKCRDESDVVFGARSVAGLVCGVPWAGGSASSGSVRAEQTSRA
jgi:hypothetical protein